MNSEIERLPSQASLGFKFRIYRCSYFSVIKLEAQNSEHYEVLTNQFTLSRKLYQKELLIYEWINNIDSIYWYIYIISRSSIGNFKSYFKKKEYAHQTKNSVHTIVNEFWAPLRNLDYKLGYIIVLRSKTIQAHRSI